MDTSIWLNDSFICWYNCSSVAKRNAKRKEIHLKYMFTFLDISFPIMLIGFSCKVCVSMFRKEIVDKIWTSMRSPEKILMDTSLIQLAIRESD
jgi:hypothetical protein